MRCYFMRDGHIVSVEFLDRQDDAGRIAQSKTLFDDKGRSIEADGFEVWDGARFVYRFPEPDLRAV